MSPSSWCLAVTSALFGKERALLYGTKGRSPQLGFQGTGKAELHWVGGTGEAALHTRVHHRHGGQEMGAQPDTLCSAALQQGKGRWGFGHLQPPSVVLSTSAWGWSSCYQCPVNPSMGAQPPALALPLPQTEVIAQLQWPAPGGVNQKAWKQRSFCNCHLVAIIFVHTINKPSFLLHTGKGDHNSFGAASVSRS